MQTRKHPNKKGSSTKLRTLFGWIRVRVAGPRPANNHAQCDNAQSHARSGGRSGVSHRGRRLLASTHHGHAVRWSLCRCRCNLGVLGQHAGHHVPDVCERQEALLLSQRPRWWAARCRGSSRILAHTSCTIRVGLVLRAVWDQIAVWHCGGGQIRFILRCVAPESWRLCPPIPCRQQPCRYRSLATIVSFTVP